MKASVKKELADIAYCLEKDQNLERKSVRILFPHFARFFLILCRIPPGIKSSLEIVTLLY